MPQALGKRPAAPAAEPAAKTPRGGRGRGGGGRGGGGRGAGRKAAMPGLGVAAAVGEQISLASLLGARQQPTPQQPAGEPMGEWLEWDFCHHDGGDEDTLLPQKQQIKGKIMLKRFAVGRPGVLLAEGTDEMVYWVDENDTTNEDPEDHERARRCTRNGMFKLQLDGEEEPTWASKSHVRAVTAPSPPPPRAGGQAAAATAATAAAAPGPAAAAAAGVAAWPAAERVNNVQPVDDADQQDAADQQGAAENAEQQGGGINGGSWWLFRAVWPRAQWAARNGHPTGRNRNARANGPARPANGSGRR